MPASIVRATTRDFKERVITRALQKKPSDEAIAIAKGYAGALVKDAAAEAGSRVRRFIASTADIDREGDTIDQAGWELDNFAKGGVALWAHDSRLLPPAKSLGAVIESGRLMWRAEFNPADMDHPCGMGFGTTLMRCYDEGILRSVSVGFLPKEWTWNEERGGFAPADFKRQELLEVSFVPVPANPNALFVAGAKGIDLLPLAAWGEMARDANSDLWVARSTYQELLDGIAQVKPKTISIPAPAPVPEPLPPAPEAKDAPAPVPAPEPTEEEIIAKAVRAEADAIKRAAGMVAGLRQRGRTLTAAAQAELHDLHRELGGFLETVLRPEPAPASRAAPVIDLAKSVAASKSLVVDFMRQTTGRIE